MCITNAGADEVSSGSLPRLMTRNPCLDRQPFVDLVVHHVFRARQCVEMSWANVEVSGSKDRKVKSMPLLQILVVLIVVGVLLWLVNQFIPMAGSIKSILNAVVVICVVLWLLNVFGLFHSLSRVRIG
jgi:hypothetical protein